MNNIQEKYLKWLNSPKVSSKDKELLKNMSQKEIDDAFFKDVEFGTAGMRGLLGPGTNRLNEFSIKKASIGFAKYILETYPNAKEDGIVISHDNRHYSREFTLQTANIFNAFGIKAYIFDSLRPTPELSYAVRYKKAAGGVMITASHNPKEYNGYKVYDEQGCQLVPGKIKRLLEIIDTLGEELELEEPHDITRGETIVLGKDVDDTYVELVESISLHPELPKKGFKIVYTPQHGTSYVNALRVFNDFGYEFYPVKEQCTFDPDFSATLSPNPEEEKAYIEPIKLAKEIGAHIVTMTDPDGDRCGLAVLHNGEYVLMSGNQSAALLLDYILKTRQEKGTLAKNGVMYNTIVTSSLGKDIAEHYGVKTEQFLTGFKFIGDQIHHYELLGDGPTFEFGYEESYGCLIAPFVRDKDGIQAILMYSEMALYYHLQGKDLIEAYDDLEKRFGYHADITLNKSFPGMEGSQNMERIMNSFRANKILEFAHRKVVRVEDYLSSRGYEGDKEFELSLPKSNVIKMFFIDKSTLTIRPSGTEPKIKFYIGAVADSHEKANQVYLEIKAGLDEYMQK